QQSQRGGGYEQSPRQPRLQQRQVIEPTEREDQQNIADQPDNFAARQHECALIAPVEAVKGHRPQQQRRQPDQRVGIDEVSDEGDVESKDAGDQRQYAEGIQPSASVFRWL